MLRFNLRKTSLKCYSRSNNQSLIKSISEKIEGLTKVLIDLNLSCSIINQFEKEITKFLDNLSKEILEQSDEVIIRACIKNVIISKTEEEYEMKIIPEF